MDWFEKKSWFRFKTIRNGYTSKKLTKPAPTYNYDVVFRPLPIKAYFIPFYWSHKILQYSSDHDCKCMILSVVFYFNNLFLYHMQKLKILKLFPHLLLTIWALKT
jgi:hypothetical protein